MKTIAELILSGGSAEFSYHDEQYLIQQESNKGCHYLSLWRVAPKAACLCRVCFEVFDGLSEETIEELKELSEKIAQLEETENSETEEAEETEKEELSVNEEDVSSGTVENNG